MKIILTSIILLLQISLYCQSPYTSIKINMDSAAREFKNYKIEMKTCEPNKKTSYTNRFSIDTSTINFNTLKQGDVNCGKYIYNGEGIDVLSGDDPYENFNTYLYQNQLSTWEKIFIFRISDYSSRGWWPSMYIVLPMKYKSFITYIEVNEISFQSGKVIFLSDIVPVSDKAKSINKIVISVKNEQLIDVKDFILKTVLEAE